MRIALKLFGELRRHHPDGEGAGRNCRLELPEGTTIRQLIMRLGIPYGEDEGLVLAAVDDAERGHETVLQDGDRVSLFEPLAGG